MRKSEKRSERLRLLVLWVVSVIKNGLFLVRRLRINQLANQIAPDEERALGVQWDVENDLFFVKPNLEKPVKKQKKNEVVVSVVKVPDESSNNL